ncbi:hypothetical protein FO519_008776 [Halicephalobus sp. NKZ332]|nr:hypothetical protein FO519_008776 [Halicephalobus sp. NKZ332]
MLAVRAPCTYPRLSCCSPFSAGVYNGSIVCGPQPADAATPTSAPPTCCPDAGIWGDWSAWANCTGSCGTCTNTTRTRTCLTESQGCACTGDDTDTQECQVVGVWSSWTVASQCNSTCGACGTTVYNRTCQTAGCACVGDTTRTEPCALTPCTYPNQSCCDGSACNDTCGLCGSMVSTRTCQSAAQGCPCTGSTQQSSGYCPATLCAYPRNSCCSWATRKLVGKTIQCVAN